MHNCIWGSYETVFIQLITLSYSTENVIFQFTFSCNFRSLKGFGVQLLQAQTLLLHNQLHHHNPQTKTPFPCI